MDSAATDRDQFHWRSWSVAVAKVGGWLAFCKGIPVERRSSALIAVQNAAGRAPSSPDEHAWRTADLAGPP